MAATQPSLLSLIGLLGLTLGSQADAAILTEHRLAADWGERSLSTIAQDATPQTNFEWMIRGAEGHEQTTRRIDSRESPSAANRSTLTITYDMATTDVPVPPWSLLLLGGTLAATIARKARA